MTPAIKPLSSTARTVCELLNIEILANILGLTHVDEREVERIKHEGQKTVFINGYGDCIEIHTGNGRVENLG